MYIIFFLILNLKKKKKINENKMNEDNILIYFNINYKRIEISF